MSETAAYFDSKTLLVTGATGFLGKALLERILWQLPQVRRVFLLMRAQSDNDPEGSVRVRAEETIFSSAIFERLRRRHGPRFEAFIRNKIRVISGDISCADLGLAPRQIDELAAEVDLVINVAAAVAFDERPDIALRSNTLGPSHLLTFAKRLRHPTLLHVSTAFVCGRRTGCIPEQVPNGDMPPFRDTGMTNAPPYRIENEIAWALRVAQSVEDESRTSAATSKFRNDALSQLSSVRVTGKRLETVAERNRQRWIRENLAEQGLSRARRYGWFDTYTFTKSMGEQLLSTGNGVPVIILRPSIIESSLAQPEPGWIEGFRMSSPILFGYGRGELPDFPGKRDSVIDFIPLDFVVSAILVSLTTARDSNNPKVFQIASGSENPLRLWDLMQYTHEYFRQFPLRTSLQHVGQQPWHYRSRDEFDQWLARRRKMLRFATTACEHLGFWPGATWLCRKLVARQINFKRLEYLSRLYADYTRIACHFSSDNTRQMFQSLDAQDKRDFFFDPTAIDWPKYIREIHLPGVRRHVVKKAS